MNFKKIPTGLKNKVRDYAREGLRTLVFGYK